MLHPYQCLAKFKCIISVAPSGVLIAASGPTLFVLDHENHRVLSTWPEAHQPKEDDEGSNSSTEIITMCNEDRHRAKRRRRSLAAGKSIKGVSDVPNLPEITILCVAKDECYVAVVTGSDKSVHVLKLRDDGILEHQSQRQMTKRPCALAFDSHGESILVGDKFGDVYSLPLHYNLVDKSVHNPANEAGNGEIQVFKPSASDVTVHTGRNLRSLEAQKQAPPQKTKSKGPMDFSNDLLLGHVSMLTDIISINLDVSTDPNPMNIKSRSSRHYIITADRDEHVRVSRGQPQAHIIENYCFGHKQFVSKICNPIPWLLVSGGGDEYLCAWDWRHGELICKIDLREPVRKLNAKSLTTKNSSTTQHAFVSTSQGNKVQSSLQHHDLQGEHEEQIAVSGLWTSQLRQSESTDTVSFYCACEGVPAIFHFWYVFNRQESADQLKSLKKYGFKLDILPLPGNPLDLCAEDFSIIVSVDNIHEPGSTENIREPEKSHNKSRRLYEFNTGNGSDLPSHPLGPTSLSQQNLDLLDDHLAKSAVEIHATGEEAARLRELVYITEKLRKRGNEDISGE